MRGCKEGQQAGSQQSTGFRAFFYRVRFGHGSHYVPYGRMEALLGLGSEVLALNSRTVVQATTSLEMGLTEPRVAITRSRGGWTMSSTSVATDWGQQRLRMRW